jgi:hypothetical protein
MTGRKKTRKNQEKTQETPENNDAASRDEDQKGLTPGTELYSYHLELNALSVRSRPNK